MLRIILTLLISVGVLADAPAQAESVWKTALPVEAPLDIEWVGEMEEGGVPIKQLRYTGSVWKSEPQRVYALYARPEGEGPFPAILQIHGGGQTCYPSNISFFVKAGYACLSFDWTGPRDNRPESEITLWHEDFRGEYMDPDHLQPGRNLVHHAVLSAIRGIDVLCAQPEVDAERIGFQGISWGGYITWLVNGLEPRLKAAVPVYGIGGLEKQWSGIGTALRNRSVEFQEYWKTNYDPESFAATQQSPVLFVNASNDFFGQLDECERRLDQVTVPHRRSYGINRMHSLDPESVEAAMSWFDTHLKGNGECPEAPGLELNASPEGTLVATLEVDESRPLHSVRLDYARGCLHPLLKCWLTAEATRTGEGTWKAEIPLIDSAISLCLLPQAIYEEGSLLTGKMEELVPAREFPSTKATDTTSDTLCDWDSGPSGWIIQRGTDFTHSQSKDRLESGDVDGRRALVYQSENPPHSIRLVNRLFADAGRNKGNRKNLVFWAHDLSSVTLRTNWFLRQPAAVTHRAELEGGAGWVKHVVRLEDFAPVDEETDGPVSDTGAALENWNDVHLLDMAAETAPEGLPAIGWMGWE